MAAESETVLQTEIIDNADGPKAATGDSGSINQHSLREQIAADRYIQSFKATRNKRQGLRMVRFEPGGAF